MSWLSKILIKLLIINVKNLKVKKKLCKFCYCTTISCLKLIFLSLFLDLLSLDLDSLDDLYSLDIIDELFLINYCKWINNKRHVLILFLISLTIRNNCVISKCSVCLYLWLNSYSKTSLNSKLLVNYLFVELCIHVFAILMWWNKYDNINKKWRRMSNI